jgi:hypothetical protein
VLTVPPNAPSLTSFSQSASVWREALAKPRGAKRGSPVATTFSFQLNVPATVTFKFTNLGRHCQHKGCTVTAGALTVSGTAGSNRLVFKGRFPRSAPLAPGKYTVFAVATTSGGSSAPKTLTFTILPA